MSYVLRHSPDEFGLVLSSDGSVPVNELLSAFNSKGYFYTYEDIESVMRLPGKKRFKLENGRIMAYYGHSVKTEVVREEVVPPLKLFHATSHNAIETILKEGLLPMTRQHVHLSATRETALLAGRRRDKNPILLKIDALNAFKAGVKFYKGNEDVFLSDSIPSEFIAFENDG